MKKSISELKELITSLSLQWSHLINQASNNASANPYNGGSFGYQMPTRFTKIDFLKFKGDGDVSAWVYRCKRFFKVDQTPEEAKV